MKLYFKDQTFSYELLRAASYASYGGAELGECLATAARIKQGDFEDWFVAWHRTAERVRAVAVESLARGHRVSAREALLRASNYYRTAEFFLAPNDPRRLAAYEQGRETFRRALPLLDTLAEAVRIPFEGVELPGYFFGAAGAAADERRPALLLVGGFDSTAEELYFAGAAAAVRRGYHCLAFEGPGQGELLRLRNMVARPDYEVPVRAALDYLVGRADVDPERLALMGASMGGYYAPRAAAFEPRIRALVVLGVFYDTWGVLARESPLVTAVTNLGAPWLIDGAARLLERVSPGFRWMVANGLWVFGAKSRAEAAVRILPQFTLKGVAEQVTCPTLVLHGERDHFVPLNQVDVFYRELRGPKTLRIFTANEGAEEHCQMGNLGLMHQVAFDWLDEALAPGPAMPRPRAERLAVAESSDRDALTDVRGQTNASN